jgi:hypothetical protein
VILARPARAGREVVFEVGVAAADLERAGERCLGQRRAPEVGVHDHPCRVQGAAQARCTRRLELVQRAFAKVAGLATGRDFFTRARESLAGRRDRQRRSRTGEPLVSGELVDGGKVAELHCNPSLGRRCRE